MQVDLSAFRSDCRCGRPHPISLRAIRIARGALHTLPEMIAGLGRFDRIGLICDQNTWAAAGETVARLVHPAAQVILDPAGLHADEAAVAAAEAPVAGCDLLLAVGSGTVHDITRYIGHAHGIPFVAVPTAPSVDGFVSTVAAMTWGGCKKTFPSTPPIALCADSDVFARCPRRLIGAGVGDLLGKYTALLDWRAAHLLTGEYICDTIIGVEEEAVALVRAQLPQIAAGDPDAIERLMYGLVLSGLAMQGVGNSRPASGAEHHLSHLWEMDVLNPTLDAYHGEQVAVGAVLLCDEYRKILQFDDPRAHLAPRTPIDPDALRAVFGDARLPGILAENTPNPLDAVTDEALCAQWGALQALVRALPTADELRAALRDCGGVWAPEQIGLPASLMPDSLRLAPYVRARLTLLRIMKRLRF